MTATRFPFRATSRVGIVLFGLATCLSSGCRKQDSGPGGGPNEPPPGKSSLVTKQPNAEEGAKAVLSEFLKPNADHAALSERLRPTKDDCQAVFEPEFAKKAEATYAPAWDGGQVVIAPKLGQTQMLLYSAITEDLKKWAGYAAEHFPGGYQKVAPNFKDGLVVYSFKFVEPGKTHGMAYDGLVHVNGSWRIFPKPWRVAE
jgi:hypothetical protein